MPGGVLTATVNALAVACGLAPPPTLVARPVASKPLAPVPSGPSATFRVLPAAESAVVSSSVAVCTVSAPLPVNVIVGVAVVLSPSVTPVFRPLPLFSASVQSPVLTLVPPMASGTSITSSTAETAVIRRDSDTVNSTFSSALPAVTAPEPVRASEATVGSSSRMMRVRDVLPLSRTSVALRPAASSTFSVSSGSSAVSARVFSVTLPTVWPEAMVMLLPRV